MRILPPPRWFTTEEIRKILRMPEAIEAVREAFAQLSSGLARVPRRPHLEIPEYRTTVLAMPAYLPGPRESGSS